MASTPSRLGAASILEVLTMTDRLLTIAQLTDLLGLSRATIYRTVAANPTALPIIKIGRASRWRESDVQAFIASAGKAAEGMA
ncbi:MAG: helix-turn-helix transcriptional regulator [Rubrimonas sp.]